MHAALPEWYYVPREAGRAIAALIDVAAASGYRWPELFGAGPVGGRLAPSPFGALPVQGLQVGGRPLTVDVDAAGDVAAVEAPEGIDIVLARPPGTPGSLR